MQTWMPGARVVRPVNTTAPSFTGPKRWKVVLHTTESSRGNQGGASNYHGHQSYPHFEVEAGVGITQFFPIDVAAKALANDSRPGETNRAYGIQIECVWRAANEAWPAALLNLVAEVTAWVHEQTGMELNCLDFLGDDDGRLLAAEGSSIRRDLTDYSGVCGHQHFRENDHWDPGHLPYERLMELVRGLVGQPTPTTSQEDTVFSPSPVPAFHFAVMHSQLLLTAEPKKHGRVTQQEADGSLGQRWMVYGHTDGTFSLVVRDEKWAEGLALDVPNNAATAGALLQVYPFDAGIAQRFVIEGVAPGIGIIKPASNPDVAIDLFFASGDAGALVGLYTQHGQDNQRLLGLPTV